MPRTTGARSLRRFVVPLLAVAVAAGGMTVIGAPAASAATGIPNTGSILYVLGGDVYATTPDGSARVQVTRDGTTPTTDGTGDTGYSVPSESDAGLVVAVRNQEFNKGQASEYTQGFIWEMDRAGHVIRKFKPAQFTYIGGGGCTAPVQQLPQGVYNAVVSPDGKRIAYTAQDYVQSPAPSCSAAQGYSSWIANIDGSGATMIADTSGNTASLEIGQFTADSSKLLVDRADFGSVQTFYVNVPGSTAQPWTAPSDYVDQAYGQAVIRNSVMATDGYSEYSNARTIRLWTFSDFAHQPVGRCEWQSAVSTSTDEYVGRPSLAPDGSAAVFVDTNGPADAANEGIYLLPTTAAVAGDCSASTSLFVAHATDPFWTPAGIYLPPSVTFTAKPAAYTRSRTATVQFTGSDPDPSRHITGYTCKLDSGTAQACTSPVSLTGLAEGVHTLAVTASDGAQTGTASVSWRVDTSVPSAAVTAPTAAFTVGNSARVSWQGSDTGSGVAKYQVRYQRAPYNGGFGSWTYPSSWQALTGTSVAAGGLAAGYDYCYSVRAVDKAGNTSAWSASRCTAIPLDDRALTASTGWSRLTGSGYYLSTATATSKLNATLTRSSVALKRVAVLATTCATCGKAGVYVGSTLVATLNLASSTTRNKVLLSAPVFSLRTGTVTLKVLTSAKLVRIDGLAVSRT